MTADIERNKVHNALYPYVSYNYSMHILGKKSESYVAGESPKNVIDLIREEADKNLLKKKYNISSRISKDGGIDLIPTIVFASFTPTMGPLAMVNLTTVNVSLNGSECKMILSRVNGQTYKLHMGLALSISIIVLLLALYQFIMGSKGFDLKILIIPLFGLFYMLIIESVADLTTHCTKNRILKILRTKRVSLKKQ